MATFVDENDDDDDSAGDAAEADNDDGNMGADADKADGPFRAGMAATSAAESIPIPGRQWRFDEPAPWWPRVVLPILDEEEALDAAKGECMAVDGLTRQEGPDVVRASQGGRAAEEWQRRTARRGKKKMRRIGQGVDEVAVSLALGCDCDCDVVVVVVVVVDVVMYL